MRANARTAATIAVTGLFAASISLATSRCFAAEPGADPAVEEAPAAAPPPTSGVEVPAEYPDDAVRAAGNGLLYLPRQMIDLVFLATGTAAGLVQDEQVVPRLAEQFFPDQGEIGVFPTAFAETGKPANVGARMIANLGQVATSLRAGFGGLDDLVVESRIRLAQPTPVPLVFSLEGRYDRTTGVEYLGVGQDPETDARNTFLDPSGPRVGLYLQTRQRGIASIGLRPFDDIELFLSGSLTQRRIEDSPDSGNEALSRVFAPGTIDGPYASTRTFYGELAFRLDTRVARGRPSPGVLFETYYGTGRGAGDEGAVFSRTGGRFAWFFPIYRATNILSPKIAFDGVLPLAGTTLPFTDLTRQPDFRGFDDHLDRVSLVTSLDYRWTVWRYLAARVFVDLATVAPSANDVFAEAPRYAAGFGVDAFSSSAELAQLAAAFSPDGVRVLLSIGISSEFGDRQHRD